MYKYFYFKEDELLDLRVLAVMVSLCIISIMLYSLCVETYVLTDMPAVNGSLVPNLSEFLNYFLKYQV